MITQFAIRLICGLSVVWCVMPRAQVTSGFFRIQMLVTLGLSVLATVAAGKLTATLADAAPVLSTTALQVLTGAIAVGSFLGSVMWTLERRRAGAACAFAIAGLSMAAVALSSVSLEQLQTLTGTLYWISEISLGLLSGSAVAGMLLGHWYLTAPTMSISPLNRVNQFLGWSAGLRLLLASAALMLFGPLSSGSQTVPWTSTHFVWLSLEWLAGILGQFVVVWMVWKIMKLRNTQAATGVLFVGVILAFLGEMTAALLRRELDLPL